MWRSVKLSSVLRHADFAETDGRIGRQFGLESRSGHALALLLDRGAQRIIRLVPGSVVGGKAQQMEHDADVEHGHARYCQADAPNFRQPAPLPM